MTDIQNILTENLDIWTSAVQTKNGVGRGNGKKLNLYGIKKIRELILELAVRGKLVPQDENDEPASVLLERIAAEKERLIKEKKIKQPKKILEIGEYELPFELPQGWEWVRLPEISHYKPGKTPATKNSIYWDDYGNGIPWVSIADMNHYGDVSQTKKSVTEEARKKVFKGEPVKAGTIIMSFKLTVGKISILGVDAYHNEAIISIEVFSGVSKEYLFRFLPSRAQVGNTKKAIMGNTLNSESLSLLLIPVPPLSEQHRIVARVDELMALCDQLEQQTEDSITAHKTLVETLLATLTKSTNAEDLTQNWNRISDHFETLFTTEDSIDQLKQTILQLAVMGKLVPQDSNDESASVLIKKIATEKAELIKKKKIKTTKALPPVDLDEVPYILPDQWAWCRMNETGLFERGKSKHRPRNDTVLFKNGLYPLVQTGDVSKSKYNNYIINTYTKKYNDVGLSQSRIWGIGTLCITIAANIAETGFLGIDACFPDSIVGFIPLDDIITGQYLRFYLQVIKTDLEKYAPATAQKNINLGIINNLLFPMPPIAEQHRIVTKTDQLMSLCNKLQSKITQSQIDCNIMLTATIANLTNKGPKTKPSKSKQKSKSEKKEPSKKKQFGSKP